MVTFAGHGCHFRSREYAGLERRRDRGEIGSLRRFGRHLLLLLTIDTRPNFLLGPSCHRRLAFPIAGRTVACGWQLLSGKSFVARLATAVGLGRSTIDFRLDAVTERMVRWWPPEEIRFRSGLRESAFRLGCGRIGLGRIGHHLMLLLVATGLTTTPRDDEAQADDDKASPDDERRDGFGGCYEEKTMLNMKFMT